MKKFSLVVPCYYEGPHLNESVEEVRRVLDNSPYDYEIIFVDDKSGDNTRDVITHICNKYDNCRFIFHEKNKGRGAAFKTGFKEARGDIVGFIDIDLEVGAHYIPPLIAKISSGDFDIASGFRFYMLSQTKSFHRFILSHGYRSICNVLLNLGLSDTESGCKFFNKETTRDAVLGSSADGWFWDTEVMARAKLQGLRICEMPVIFLRRLDKQSTVRVITDTIDYFVELRRFRKNIGLGILERSPIYWSDKLYLSTMKLLFGSKYEQTFKEVADNVPAGSKVIDLCFGTNYFYKNYLADKNISYIGVDYNGRFVLSAQKSGLDARLLDVISDPLPKADIITMNSSLYHFRSHEELLINKLKQSAKKIIISEPIENLSTHSFKPIAKLATILSKPGAGKYSYRYSTESFKEFAEKHSAKEFINNKNSRNAVAIFDGDL